MKEKETLHVYLRVCSAVQKEGVSLEVQEKVAREIAKKNNWKIELYQEGSASSNNENLDKRPQLAKIIFGMREGKIKHLYAWDMDRLSRNKKVSSILLMDMQENKVTLHTNNGVIDTSLRDDMLMLEIKQLFAHHDNVLRTERMKQSKLYAIKKYGVWGGGQLPYGYTTFNKKLVPHEQESKWVQKMFGWYYDGKPLIWIKKQLDKENVIARRGGLFSTGSIMRLFQNTHYMGEYIHTDKESGEVIELTCKPIVDEKIWKFVQTKIRENKDRYRQVGKTTKNFYLLRHLMFCGCCGSKMHGLIKPKFRRNYYYCPKKGKDWKKGKLQEEQKWVRGKIGEHGCDNTRSVNIANMDRLVLTKVLETLRNSSLLKETFKREVLKEKQIGNKDDWEYERVLRLARNDRNKLKRKVEEYRSSLATIETNLILGDIEDKELTQQVKDKLVQKFQTAKDDLEKSRLRIEELEQQSLWIDWLSKYQDKYLDWEKFSKEELQDALNKFVERIEVNWDAETQSHNVLIRFKLPLVKDGIDYNDPDDKGKGYKVKDGSTDERGSIPVKSPWETKKDQENLATLQPHSTVTDFAKFLG